MCEVPVLYATTEGQTRRIAERIAGQLREHGLDAVAIDVESRDAEAIQWDRVRGVCLGASIHVQSHQRAALDFARRHARAMMEKPSTFFSVSLAAASKSAQEVEAAMRLARNFEVATGWHPTEVVSLAGRLAYTQYGWFKRQVMRHIASKEGGSTDTTRDHEYTDWAVVDGLAHRLANEIHRYEERMVAV
jgi:menaquinone-dependent protoporphyrinogen oxidase